jgi:hypothetical protein
MILSDDDELLAELGVLGTPIMILPNLTHVKPRAEINAAEEIADRTALQRF